MDLEIAAAKIKALEVAITHLEEENNMLGSRIQDCEARIGELEKEHAETD